MSGAEWKLPTTTPAVPSGEKLAVRIKGARIDDKGNWRSGEFDGVYLNAYPLHYEDGCGDCPQNGDRCRQEAGNGCPTTGFHAAANHPDYDNFYLEARVDGWRPL